MSEQVVVRCQCCSQKYRVSPAAVGRKARCVKCHAEFIIGNEKPTDEDTIMAWITEDDPSSRSVMGSTGIFENSEARQGSSKQSASKPAPMVAARPHLEQVVQLEGVRSDGAHFEFPAAALAREDLRNSFPRKCVGCSGRSDLRVHLLYWPERMIGKERARWNKHVDMAIGELERFSGSSGPELLRQLPRTRHVDSPFDQPFPVFSCRYCEPSREVETHVTGKAPHESCRLRIVSLAVAVSFFRNNGGRGSHAYQRLIEERDRRHDPWRALDPQVRHGISQWFEPQPGESFVRFIHDRDFSPAQAAVAGSVLTDRRLVFKLQSECEGYPLNGEGRIEIMRKGDLAIAHIYLHGQRPAVLKLGLVQVDEMLESLRQLHCRWTVVT